MTDVAKILLGITKDYPEYSFLALLCCLFLLLLIVFWKIRDRSFAIRKDKLEFLFKYHSLSGNNKIHNFLLEQIVHVYASQEIKNEIILYLLKFNHPSKAIGSYRSGKFYTTFDTENGFKYVGDFNPTIRSQIYTTLYFVLAMSGTTLLALVFLKHITSSGYIALILIYSPASIICAFVSLIRSIRYSSSKYLVENTNTT